MSTITIDRTKLGRIKSIKIKPENTESKIDDLIEAIVYETRKDGDYISSDDMKTKLKKANQQQ